MAKASTTRKASAPKDETKAQKFSRLATARVNKAVKAIRAIGNLSGGGYERTIEQVNKITMVLEKTVTETMKRFDKTAAKESAPEILI